jgi:hypothetical protein
VQDLLLSAKHLFVAARWQLPLPGVKDEQGHRFDPECWTGLGFNPDGGRGPFSPGYRAPQKHRRAGSASSQARGTDARADR